MKYIHTLILAMVFIIPSFQANAFTPHKLTSLEKRFDFEQLINQINNQYGPKYFKKDRLGINLGELVDRYWEKIRTAKTNGEFYSLIVQFVAEFRDGHFRAWLPTKLVAYLPFTVTKIKDKVVIEYVNREKLPKGEFPFDRGDELLSMDGKPVDTLIKEFEKYIGTGNPRATEGLATYKLTWRNGSVVPVPSEKVRITVRARNSKTLYTTDMDWIIEGEQFDEHVLTPAKTMKAMLGLPQTDNKPDDEGFNPDDKSIFNLISASHPNMENTYHCNGKTRIRIPEDATILMEEPFVAYYHPTINGNIGYLRIPHYHPPGDAYDEWLEHYRWLLTIMERETEGLIIDQDHNCGGSGLYMEEIVAMFMKEEFRPIIEQLRASKMEILKWKGWLDSFKNPYNLLYEGILEAFNVLKDSHSKGFYLTPITTFRGSQLVQPKGIYTKPVIVLIDYFAASCGDAFPSMMQGLRRAKLLGTTTMGLGGYVSRMEPLFYSQIQTRMTQSLFLQPHGTPVENHGAIPDIKYEITLNDFMNEYQDYQRFYLNEIFKLIDSQS